MNLHFFSEKEAATQEIWRDRRTLFFKPLLRILTSLGVSANAVTIFGIAAGLAFPFLVTSYPFLAVCMIVLHLLADGIDGPLGRYQNTTSQSGSLFDMIADHTVMVCVMIGLLVLGLVDPIQSLIYVYTYILLVVFLVVRNIIKKPAGYIMRTKYILYASYAIYAATGFEIYEWLIPIFIAATIFPLLSSILVIAREKQYD